MASSRLLASRKSDTVLGTFESDAFLLSLRDDTELCLLHEYGYHRIPHIGASIHYFAFFVSLSPSLSVCVCVQACSLRQTEWRTCTHTRVVVRTSTPPSCILLISAEPLRTHQCIAKLELKYCIYMHTPPASDLLQCVLFCSTWLLEDDLLFFFSGVYGEFYSPCLPLALIGLPAVKK